MSLDPCTQAAQLGEAGKYPEAWKIVGRLLLENPMDPRALVTGSYVMRGLGGWQQAYHFARAATQVIPNDAAAWTNLGHAASLMWLSDEAERCYKRALVCSKTDFDRKVLWTNLSALYLDNGDFKKALTYIEKVLALDPDHHNAQANLGFCKLAMRDWSGWKGYRNTIGSDWRPKQDYGVPDWDGTPGKTVVLYEDQGLGDAISFASMVPDAVSHCRKVILDCDDRLEHLFRRSFPKAKVYGTRRAKDGKWAKEDWQIDASLPLGQIGEYYRTKNEDFPGTPYLLPCPDRSRMWRGLFEQKRKPSIGIAWTGGTAKTNARNRRVGLEDLLPVFRSIDAHWVSLQYKDAEPEIAAFRAKHRIDLKQYPFATLTNDYDDTAALVASLDYVLCIQTAVAHTAGAVGTPVTVLLPIATQWRYGTAHESIPWYDCLRVIRQEKTGSWRNEIERAARELQGYFDRSSAHQRRLPQGTGADAPDRGALRRSVSRLCANGQPDHQPDAGNTSA